MIGLTTQRDSLMGSFNANLKEKEDLIEKMYSEIRSTILEIEQVSYIVLYQTVTDNSV